MNIAPNLPDKIKPYFNAGLTWYIQHFFKAVYSSMGNPADSWPYESNDLEDAWKFSEFGLNWGLGTIYQLNDRFSALLGFKRYTGLGNKLGFWDWQLGISYSPAK